MEVKVTCPDCGGEHTVELTVDAEAIRQSLLALKRQRGGDLGLD